MDKILLFNRYSHTDVSVKDETLVPFINVSIPGIVPHTSTKVNLGRFGKCHTSIVERFTVRLMANGRNTGKKRLAIRSVEKAFEIMNELSKENPIQLLVDSVINSGPREASARVGKGGSMKRASVDVSPHRRVCIAIKLLTEGIRTTAFKNKKTLAEVIANELLAAAKNNQNSYAVKKREEVERIAKSNR
ncbi:small subunit ribosomal protein S5e [Pancytospora philotis]|nr:small subunit ribosomal protein S5e [Pancytospora philotis]